MARLGGPSQVSTTIWPDWLLWLTTPPFTSPQPFIVTLTLLVETPAGTNTGSERK